MMMTSCTIVIVTSFKYLLLYIALFQEQLCKKKKLAFLYHNETKLDEKKYIYFSQSFYLLIIVRFSCFILWKKVKKKKVTMTMTRPPYFKLNMWHKNQTRQLENYTFGLLWFHFSILGLHGLHTDSSIPYRGYLWIQKNDWPIAFRCLCYVKSLNRH